MRQATIRFLCAMVVGARVAGAVLAEASEAPALRVVSYNIRGGLGGGRLEATGDPPVAPGAENLDRVIANLTALRADVVGFQEIRGARRETRGIDQPKYLAERLGFHFTTPEDHGQRNTVMSRYPILAQRHVQLNVAQPRPDLPDTMIQARYLTAARVAVPGHPDGVWFLNTHLENRTSSVRKLQISRAATFVTGELLPGYDGPFVLMGDFNAQPDSDEIAKVLPKRMWPLVVTDASLLAPDGQRPTHPSDHPDRKIDFVFVTAGVGVKRCRPVARDPGASDHLPLTALLWLGDARPPEAMATASGAAPRVQVETSGGFLGQSEAALSIAN